MNANSLQPKRLDRILANAGYCSRKEAGKFIRSGRVAINGEATRDQAAHALLSQVTIDGELLNQPETILVMLNKPVGYVCSHDGSEGPRIYDFLPDQWMLRNPAPMSIGRLDKDTSGLILITDDTMLVHEYTSPKNHVEKWYEVEVDHEISATLTALFASGTLLLSGETTPCLPAELHVTGERTCTITVTEGKYHLVRKMFGYAGYDVTKLHRVRFGPYELGNLASGCIEEVSVR
jgi:16S rRNA pseudouridine516 synthase